MHRRRGRPEAILVSCRRHSPPIRRTRRRADCWSRCYLQVGQTDAALEEIESLLGYHALATGVGRALTSEQRSPVPVPSADSRSFGRCPDGRALSGGGGVLGTVRMRRLTGVFAAGLASCFQPALAQTSGTRNVAPPPGQAGSDDWKRALLARRRSQTGDGSSRIVDRDPRTPAARAAYWLGLYYYGSGEPVNALSYFGMAAATNDPEIAPGASGATSAGNSPARPCRRKVRSSESCTICSTSGKQ
ncbi:MAG: hypothetical protein R3E12_05810 [Candidatus Eisenbacteria bacterium]